MSVAGFGNAIQRAHKYTLTELEDDFFNRVFLAFERAKLFEVGPNICFEDIEDIYIFRVAILHTQSPCCWLTYFKIVELCYMCMLKQQFVHKYIKHYDFYL